ncbi:hypothetical protein STEG23_012466 [Scotinomys teguina]
MDGGHLFWNILLLSENLVLLILADALLLLDSCSGHLMDGAWRCVNKILIGQYARPSIQDRSCLSSGCNSASFSSIILGAIPPLLARTTSSQHPGPQTVKALSSLSGVPAVPGGLLELKSMIGKVTGKDPIMNYGFYGCYCGWGGKGTPKDGTDWCCQMHDRCYGELENSCSIWTQSYDYRFSQGMVMCEYTSYCSGKLCDCDRKLVYCLRRNLRSYNPLYQYYPNFLC